MPKYFVNWREVREIFFLFYTPPGLKILVEVFDFGFNKYKSSNVIIKLGTIFTESEGYCFLYNG